MNIIVRTAVLLGLLSASQGCASFGSKAVMYAPETATKITRIIIWPPVVTPNYDWPSDNRAYGKSGYQYSYIDSVSIGYRTSMAMGDTLAEVLGGRFEILKLSGLEHLNQEYLESLPDTCAAQFRAGQELGADGMLITKVLLKDGSNGENSYVDLFLFDIHSRSLVATSSFNTMWGKSYFNIPDRYKTLPDGTRGAAEVLLKKLGGTSSPNGRTLP